MNWQTLRQRTRPAIIAHGAGNRREDIEKAAEQGADAVEADVYVHAGDFEARHERAIYPIPLWLERWYVKLAPRSRFRLGDMFDATGDRLGLFLDVKNGGEHAPGIIRRALEGPYAGAQLAVSSGFWYILRRIIEQNPRVSAFYSIDGRAGLDLFLSVIERDRVPAGVSCRHTLLDPEIIELLHARDMTIVAWTVDDAERARELAEWGVDAITTNEVEAVRRVVGGAA